MKSYLKNWCISFALIGFFLPALSQWSSGSLPFKTARHGVEFLNAEEVIIAGGQVGNSGSSQTISDIAVIYNVNTHSWKSSSMNTPRLEPIMVRGDSGVYVIGGVSDWGNVNGNGWKIENTMEIYKNGSWTEFSIPFQTMDGNAVHVGGKIIVAGGMSYWKWDWSDGANIEGTSLLWIYDEADKTWTSRLSLDGRFFSAAASDGEIAVFVGGLWIQDSIPGDHLDGLNQSGAYEIYNSATNSWSSGYLPVGFNRSRIVGCYCDNLFVFVGGSRANGVGSNLVDIYDGQDWSHTDIEITGARAVEDCATAGNKILFAGGGRWRYEAWYNNITRSDLIDVFDADSKSFSRDTLERALQDFKMAGYNGKAILAGGVNYVDNDWTSYKEVYVFEDSSFVNVGIQMDENQKEVSIFPNPTSGDLHFFSQDLIEKVEVYDLHGEEITRIQNYESGSTLNYHFSNSGIFIARIFFRDSEKIEYKKFSVVTH